jgi:hypothetical protein
MRTVDLRTGRTYVQKRRRRYHEGGARRQLAFSFCRGWLATLIAGLCLAAFAAQPASAQVEPPKAAEEPKFNPGVLYDFRNKKFPDAGFRYMGADPGNRIKREHEGLRLTLPAGRATPGQIGVEADFIVKGDFEITVGYDIVAMEQPKPGTRVGFVVILRTATPAKIGIDFYRMVLGDGRDVYRGARIHTGDDGKSQAQSGEYHPVGGSKAGHLRITRRQAEAVVSAADEPANEFRELYRWDIGTDDVNQLQVLSRGLGGLSLVDVRLVDMRIRTTEADGIASDAVAPSRAPWRLAVVIAAALLLAALFLLCRLWIGSRKQRKA